MVEAETTMCEERKEIMVSLLGDSKPTLRIAHFLSPTVDSMDGPPPKPPTLPCSSTLSSVSQNLKVDFSCWRKHERKWPLWVNNLETKYKSVWKSAGIYEAIMSSKCNIQRDDDLVLGITEKWCTETNTFIFPWGEATITLEDVIILGGFSVSGSPVFSCSAESGELKEIQDKLHEARREVGRGPSRNASFTSWMKMFMDSGSDIEHEAFLSLWLARYVFSDSEKLIRANSLFFPIAVHLARGVRIALGPAVLASIYRDLSLLKAITVTACELETSEGDNDKLAVKLWSPFQLVQLWVWERFPSLQPKPKPGWTQGGYPRSVLWNNLSPVKVENIRLVLDSAGENFCWRPYAARITEGLLPNFYSEKEEWKTFDRMVDGALSFALCLRVSELVGLDSIEQYLPNRVAMQFGMDQDLPASVSRRNETSEIAWSNYMRPLGITKLFFPSRFFKPNVSIQYLEWWRESEHDSNTGVPPGFPPKPHSMKEPIEDDFPPKPNRMKEPVSVGNLKPTFEQPVADCNKKNYATTDVPPGFPPNSTRMKEAVSVRDIKPTFAQSIGVCNKIPDVPPGFTPKPNKMKEPVSLWDVRPTNEHTLGDCSKKNSAITDVPPDFPPKSNTRKEPDPLEKVNTTAEELQGNCNKKSDTTGRPSAFGNVGELCRNDSITVPISEIPKEIGSQMTEGEAHVHISKAKGNSPRALRNTTDSNDGSLVHNAKGINVSVGEINILELEARIARLENIIAKGKQQKVR
ncbi:hypothetical protein Tsubulata_020435 [Turnera subulata]|uniref:Aminotransferase-like plant mobile domain-containing protein n=1 Tax=Turnera subulata TaxID=218843 RepID=A0A9Q0JNN7_9ROSI|nr:hypothetical protein Tsubulata_020435 [Turnera subulata]